MFSAHDFNVIRETMFLLTDRLEEVQGDVVQREKLERLIRWHKNVLATQ